MNTLQLNTHIENNRQLNITLPSEYANQDVELVLIIQSSKKTLVQQNWLAFLDQTYGCLANNPLERPQQPELNEIDALL
jgi:hypothetical protein